MPKIIDEARERILQTAKRMLFNEGYHKLSLRCVARDCSIAVGTIYNYFKNKDTLIASIMIVDWEEALTKMDKGCEVAHTIGDGFIAIYEAIEEFSLHYKDVWNNYSSAGGSAGVVGSHHLLLREQISKRILELLKNFGCEQDKNLSPLLAELVLAAALQPDITSSHITTVVDRLFQ